MVLIFMLLACGDKDQDTSTEEVEQTQEEQDTSSEEE